MVIKQWLKMPAVAAVAAVLAAGLVAPNAEAQKKIYKVVDENGNVVYTDRRPADDAQPMELPELSVVDPVKIGDPSAIAPDAGGNAAGQQAAGDVPDVPIPGLQLVSPTPNETVQNTGYRLPVRVTLDGEMPPDTELAFLVDGEVRQTGQSPSATLDEVWRGQHSVQVQLRSADGRVLASTQSVPFMMRQHSA
ncbi:MAG: hypothetical protein RQ847_13060, partial [Wenzhouxiangellaceae bacterium]|nr:hypothetical protein [Wenzhouxiangellaceae bacterium]